MLNGVRKVWRNIIVYLCISSLGLFVIVLAVGAVVATLPVTQEGIKNASSDPCVKSKILDYKKGEISFSRLSDWKSECENERKYKNQIHNVQ